MNRSGTWIFLALIGVCLLVLVVLIFDDGKEPSSGTFSMGTFSTPTQAQIEAKIAEIRTQGAEPIQGIVDSVFASFPDNTIRFTLKLRGSDQEYISGPNINLADTYTRPGDKVLIGVRGNMIVHFTTLQSVAYQ